MQECNIHILNSSNLYFLLHFFPLNESNWILHSALIMIFWPLQIWPHWFFPRWAVFIKWFSLFILALYIVVSFIASFFEWTLGALVIQHLHLYIWFPAVGQKNLPSMLMDKILFWTVRNPAEMKLILINDGMGLCFWDTYMLFLLTCEGRTLLNYYYYCYYIIILFSLSHLYTFPSIFCVFLFNKSFLYQRKKEKKNWRRRKEGRKEEKRRERERSWRISYATLIH